MSNAKEPTRTAFAVNFVQTRYFLDRIHELEVKYRDQWEGWEEFLSAYSNNRVDRNNSDFDEWAFLCNHFKVDLTESGRDTGSARR